VLTKREAIQSAKKGNFVIYKGIARSGATAEIFLTEDDEQKYGLSEDLVADVSTIDEIFNREKSVEVEYNERGRVDSVSVPE